MSLRGRALLGALAVTVVTALPLPAQAAEARGRILELKSNNGTVSVLFSGVDLPAGTTIDPASVSVSVDGQKISSSTKGVDGATTKVQRTAIVVIDTSGSMLGARLAGAKSAAQAFVRSLPAGVSIGLVTFGSTAALTVPVTTNRERITRAVDGLVATGDTALYDAAALAARSAGRSGARTVLLLSDGRDDGSKTTLAGAVSAVRASGALVSAVALGQDGPGSAPLAQIATASGGSLLTAPQADDLAAAFTEAARTISGQVLVTATLPAEFSKTSGTVRVTATAGAVTVSDQAFTPLVVAGATADPTDFGPRAVDTAPTFARSETAFRAALVAVFLGILVLLSVAITSATRDSAPSGVRRRLSIYTLAGRGPTRVEERKSVYGDSAVARTAVEFADRVVARRDFEGGLERRLDAAGVPLRPAEWLLLHSGTTLATAMLSFLLSSGDILTTLLGLLLGLGAPLLYLTVKEGRRTGAFLSQLPDTLQLVAGGLSAGYSLPQSLDSVVREGTQPIAGEFNRALVESRLGVPVEEALDGISTRMKSNDFSWVVMAIRIQREVGGNLAEVLNTVAATLRERQRLRRQVQVLSAEGRLSAYILGLLPAIFALYLFLVRREYVTPLFTDPIGVFLLVVLAAQLTVGAFWLRKVVTVEV